MKKLYLITLVALVLFVAIVYQADSINRSRTQASAEAELDSRAQRVATEIDQAIESRMIETFTFSALPSFRGFAASDETARPARTVIALAELQGIVAADPDARAASITNLAGLVILTTDRSMNADWSERPFVREGLQGHLYVSEPARDFRELSHYYSAPILNNAGDVAGVLVLRVSAQELWGLLDDEQNVMVVDDAGVRIVDRSDKPQAFMSLAPLPPMVVSSLMAEHRYGEDLAILRSTNLTELSEAIRRGDKRLVYKDEAGKTVHAATRWMATKPWVVVAFKDQDAISRAATQTLWDILQMAGLALLVGAGLGGYLTYRIAMREKKS